MSRGAYRSSTGELGRTERWNRDRFYTERDRDGDRDRFDDVLEREHEREHFGEDDHVFTRGSPQLRGPLPRSLAFNDDVVYRGRRVPYDDEPRYPPRRRSPSGSTVDRRLFIEKERSRERAFVRSPSPPRRPAVMLRRQSSLDTFDRKPRDHYGREEYRPSARRDDFRPPVNVPIPLPRSKALPPPRRYDEREYFDDIRVSDPDYYGDEEYRSYPERVREKEVIRTRRRNRSRESRSSRFSHRGSSSRSSSTSSSSSSSSGGTTVKNEYPKKGKTRIPARLVSRRALIDLGYPFVEEGNTIVIQRALGQENIDDLLHLSEEYSKGERGLVAARSHAGDIIEERRQEVIMVPPTVPAAVPVAIQASAPPGRTMPVASSGPVIVNAAQPSPAPAPVEIVDTTTVVRAVSPARSYTTSTTSYAPAVIDTRAREVSEEMAVGPLALVESSRHRSQSRSTIRSEIRDLERELARREHRHHHHYSHSHGREIIKAERLSNGELVLYEETVDKIEEPSRGVRIEKDKKGPPPKLMRAMLATLT